MISKAFARVAVAIPVLAVLASVIQAHWTHTQGDRWNLPVRAFDPRDILRGKYLNVRFEYALSESTCGEAHCCTCFEDADFSADPPLLVTKRCTETPVDRLNCVRIDALTKPYRYFIPEAHSARLETIVTNAAQEGRARVEFVLDARRRPQIVAITVDGEAILP